MKDDHNENEKNNEQTSSNKWENMMKDVEKQNETSSKNFENNLPDDMLDESHGLEFPSRTKLEDQLTALEKKVEEYRDQALRAQAMVDNIQRRTARDIENAHKYGIEKLLIDLLPVLDSLNRAMQGEEAQDPHVKNMRAGIQLTLDMFLKALNKFGVKEIHPAVGDLFNPTLHEAMSIAQNTDQEHNTIVQVMAKGYELNDRIIRAAIVIVAA
ncbi:MAG: nucleotide exchange factor GrpE [Gammaproteobacteria bacterium RIFOXYB2_FULL_38_6]|nr:MAG: nucleotide exchange factor GrpE [Gammaproteobacteria bacterium RIFOXYB2_FULL_38_6]